MATTTVNLGLSLDGLSNVDTTGKANGNILVWNGTSNKWEDATPTSGGTPAGLSGQIQFNNGGAFGADSAFHWDNTNKRLGVGATPSSSVRLDVRAQGALSTDIAFRVRNSADTFNQLEVKGDGTFALCRSNSTTDGLYANSSEIAMYRNGGQAVRVNGSWVYIDSTTAGVQIAGPSSVVYRMNQGGFDIGSDNVARSGTNTITLKNGTAPSSNLTDRFYMYSADIVAGNAAPHFRTENGSIIKLYQQSSAGITTVADIVTVLQNLGLLS